MTIRVLVEGWRNQYDRMQRSRDRLTREYQSSLEYDDDFYHVVQDAWHLKDWIAYDDALGSLRAVISKEVEQVKDLRIIADLASCTKHLVLSKNVREGAEMQSTSSSIDMQDNCMTREIIVKLNDGSEHSGIALVDAALQAWANVLARHGLL
jgi:hypothetical protein